MRTITERSLPAFICLVFFMSSLKAQWTSAPPLLLARQDNSAATGPDGKIYVAGGISGLSGVNQVEKLDPLSGTAWVTVAPMSTSRSRFALVFGTDGFLYAIGGLQGNTSLNTVERYNTATNTWQTMASMNQDRCQHAAAVGPDGRIYAIGGYSSPGGTGFKSSVEVYTPPSNSFPLGQWTMVASMTTARGNHRAVTGLDGNIYVFDGSSGNTWEVFNGTNWTSKGAFSYSAGGYESVTGPDGLMYQLGITPSVFHGSATVVAYDANGPFAGTIPDLIQSRGVSGGATAAEGRIYTAGGYRKSYGTMSFVEFLGQLKSPDFTPNIKALWRFNEANGSTVVDSKGPHTGTVVGGAVHANNGRVGKSLIFNGTSQYVKVNNAPGINFGTGDMTIETWVKWTPAAGVSVVPILDKRTSVSGKYTGYHLFINSGKLGFQLANGTTFQNYSGLQTIPANTWTHIAVTVKRTGSGQAVTMYVNSVLDKSFTPLSGNITNTAQLQIGKHQFGNTFFKGELDEFSVYNRALRWAEIRAVFLAGKEGKL